MLMAWVRRPLALMAISWLTGAHKGSEGATAE